MKKARFLMTLAIAAMAGVFTACENTPNTPVGPGTGGNEGGDSTSVAGPEATAVTVAEFIAAPESESVYYELTGTISNITSTTYGNFDLTDETGTVYVYGLTAKYIAGGTNDKSYASLGLKAGDNITIRGYRGSYTNDSGVKKDEVMGAFFVKKNSSGSGSETPGDVTGQGTKENPYTVADVIALNNTAKGPFYVKGYIVGQVGGQYLDSGSEFAAPWTTFTNSSTGQVTTYNTNLLIAVSADETNVNNVVPVQLPDGALRDALNLPENPDMHKKEVLIYGNLEKYFGAPGIKSPTYAVVDGAEYGSEPVIVDPNEQIYAESFAEGQGDFTIVDVLLPAGAEHIWYYNANYKQMAASGYINNASQNAESWLISPALDLSAKTSATFTFEHAGKQFGAPVTNLTIQVSTTYNGGEINAADWTELAIPNHLAGETNTFKSAGDIDLSKYCGNSNVRIAFKYTSTTSGSGNWYVKNVVVF